MTKKSKAQALGELVVRLLHEKRESVDMRVTVICSRCGRAIQQEPGGERVSWTRGQGRPRPICGGCAGKEARDE